VVMVENLKKQQQEGESPVDTIKRVLGGQLSDRQKAQLDQMQQRPAEEEAPKHVVYRFRTFEEMSPELTMRYGTNWQNLVSPANTISYVYGVTPQDELSQREMRRVHTANGDVVGSVLANGKTITFTKEMIQPVYSSESCS